MHIDTYKNTDTQTHNTQRHIDNTKQTHTGRRAKLTNPLFLTPALQHISLTPVKAGPWPQCPIRSHTAVKRCLPAHHFHLKCPAPHYQPGLRHLRKASSRHLQRRYAKGQVTMWCLKMNYYQFKVRAQLKCTWVLRGYVSKTLHNRWIQGGPVGPTASCSGFLMSE